MIFPTLATPQIVRGGPHQSLYQSARFGAEGGFADLVKLDFERAPAATRCLQRA
jgi:hypothetical protein